MKSTLTARRRSGILAHISSLPSPYGIGDIGTASHSFLDFLSESGQSCWQFLPLNPTCDLFDNSPYMSNSAFAGSPLLISPDLLFTEGLISRQSLEAHPSFSPYTTDFQNVRSFKSRLLDEAFRNFNPKIDEGFKNFRASTPWLDDYALFMSLKEHFGDKGWFDWPRDIATRQKKALSNYTRLCAERINYYIFEQYIFYSQWSILHSLAKEKEILLFGDIPIYVGLDSADVWAHQKIFTLDPTTCQPTHVSGVPPDYFSATGQRWGNPLYRWDHDSPLIQDELVAWWVTRFGAIFKLVDVARIDHFRGFESYWAIPAENETAVDGKWLQGPGTKFFEAVFDRLGELEIVAEDLGIITSKVLELRDALDFPGMKVLQFAFDGNPANSFLPHNFETPNCVVYTGTHDNDTTVGWYLSNQIDDQVRDRLKRTANRQIHDNSGIHDDLIHLALASTAKLAVIPLQDVLGFGNDCRMNIPGVAHGNWRWRCAPEFLTGEIRQRLNQRTELFSRHSSQFSPCPGSVKENMEETFLPLEPTKD
ncbi:4-alpha-glucanotransferase [Desulfopila aestuarii]|uniref:4-alpha-glucanotransferase n=1 Tax=Desulfopila aestuarii DSM 18488 TaxID=1121416 RepID=A0A1M7YDI7_9BACT|nr:4-alpha-glucanotransferase [Desulfopila aestuarii]SHO50661.1 4-alpha-glucanotransferase [Desulfopila aestuarii DSM 18488]